MPLRAHVPRRRDGLRRRRDHAARRGPVPHDDDDRQRRRRPRPPRGVAPDRVARPAGPRDVSVTEQWTTVAVVGPRAREVVGALAPDLDVSNEALPVHDLARGGHRGHARARVPHLVLRGAGVRAQRPDLARPGAVGGGAWPPASRSASRRTAPRRCTSCAPRRATRSSARRPTGRSRRRTSAWTGPFRRRRTSSVGGRIVGPMHMRPDRKQLVGLLPIEPDALAAGGRPARRTGRRPRPDPGADARPRHVVVPERGARPDVRPGPCQGRSRPARRDASIAPLVDGRTIEARIVDSVVFDPENLRRDGEPVCDDAGLPAAARSTASPSPPVSASCRSSPRSTSVPIRMTPN